MHGQANRKVFWLRNVTKDIPLKCRIRFMPNLVILLFDSSFTLQPYILTTQSTVQINVQLKCTSPTLANFQILYLSFDEGHVTLIYNQEDFKS